MTDELRKKVAREIFPDFEQLEQVMRWNALEVADRVIAICRAEYRDEQYWRGWRAAIRERAR